MRPERGLSVIAVAITLMLLVILALVAVSLISIRADITSNEVNAKRALYIAEAGLAVAKHALRADWSQYSNAEAFPATNFAGGSFDVEITAGTDPEKEVTATSTGTYGDSKRAIQTTLSRFSGAMEDAIFTNGDCNLNGNVEIAGDVAYSGTYVEGGNVNVTGETFQTDQPIPGLETAEAIAQARANHLNGYTSRPDGNYFQGTFSPSPSSLNGIIFVDEYPGGDPADVQIAGNINTTDGNPAFLIIMGNLRISGNVNFEGLIYTAGFTDIDITLLGNMSIDGGLITQGNVTMRGNASITYNEENVITSLTTDLLTGEDTPQERSWREISP